ncbi:MAG: response regulator transcription factor [Crocinitomicaceae bacterium]|nr:response regulator transcription factor [Crocinitomicaceae bacterium]
MTGILIADSNHLIRTGLSTLLSRHPEFQVLGEAGSEKQMLEMVRDFHPDLVLIDFAAKDFSIDAIPRVLRLQPKIRFVAITWEQTGITILNALRAGVNSYIKKDCDAQEIVDSVRETTNGGRFFCGQILDTIRREAIDVNDLDTKEYSCAPVFISVREMEIIKLIAEGYTNNEIAEKLFLSPHTVNTHRKNIMQKIGVNNTAAIVMYAVKTGLVSPNKFLFSPVN